MGQKRSRSKPETDPMMTTGPWREGKNKKKKKKKNKKKKKKSKRNTWGCGGGGGAEERKRKAVETGNWGGNKSLIGMEGKEGARKRREKPEISCDNPPCMVREKREN